MPSSAPRPEASHPDAPPGRSLAYLMSVPVERVKGIGPKIGELLREAGIASVTDLLLHVPRRYVDRSRMAPVDSLSPGQEATVIGRVIDIGTRPLATPPGRGDKNKNKSKKRKRTLTEATVTDGRRFLRVVWFNQAFRENQLPPGTEVALFGKVEVFRGKPQFTNPAVERLGDGELKKTGRIVPIYSQVKGIDTWDLQDWIDNALRRSRPIPDPVPAEVLTRHGLMDRDSAFAAVHFPDSEQQAEAARRRLVFDELFRLEVALALQKRRQVAEARGVSHPVEGELVERFLAGLPYQLTRAQQRVLDEIRRDLAAPHPMHRLLQGEVGSGKTVVAVATLLTGVQGGYQGAVMAPTEVLAEQHFLSIGRMLEEAGLVPEHEGDGAALGMESLFSPGDRPKVRLALLTSTRADTNFTSGAPRAEIERWVAEGRVDLVVGTHALIQEGVHFHRLGVAVVDEQHRFGVAQRVQLKDKAGDLDPDLLIMTATPIPRTLSMTLYGDLDVSELDEMPPGRTPVTTVALSPAEIERAYQLIRREVAEGRQAFVVCPLVEDSPKVEAASATAEYERLSQVFSDLRVGLLHGQLPPRDKEAVMDSFRKGELDLLVSTTVIEVGIDVPNATLMLIEDADRFGLSQLHQLRGRVGRGGHPGHCLLIADAGTDEGRARIEAMVATNDGFRLAEEDLRIRGQGTVFGTRQSGMADLRLADILEDFELLVAARREAFALVDADPELDQHPDLAEEVRVMLGEAVEWLFVS